MNPSSGRKTLLLTGAAGQLGTAIIQLLGNQLDVVALTHKTLLKTASQYATLFDVQTEIHEENISVKNVICDLTSESEITRAIRDIVSLVSSIDYVIYAAGDSRFLGATTDAMMFYEDIKTQFELNVFAPALICSTLFHYHWKQMTKTPEKASVLLISSLSGAELFKNSNQGFYASSKAATNMLAKHMADEYGKYGVAVNALAPNSFPSLVATSIVASNALGILGRGVTGKLFAIG